MKRLNVLITDEQHEWLRKMSYEKDVSMAEIVRGALEDARGEEDASN